VCLNRCITLKSPLLEPVREDGAETFNIDPEGRFDALHGGNARWRARIDAIKLVDITPTIIQKWKRGCWIAPEMIRWRCVPQSGNQLGDTWIVGDTP
jgi:hypothetical protein